MNRLLTDNFKTIMMKPRIQVLHWAPRILCIVAILFISLFALDSFSPELSIWQQISGFAIHLIPTYVLIITLYIAWKRELIGGIIFIAIGLILSPFVFSMNYDRNQSIMMSLGIILSITIPFVIVGGLFLLSHFIKRKYKAG